MKKNPFWYLIGFFVIFSLILTSCGPGTTTTSSLTSSTETTITTTTTTTEPPPWFDVTPYLGIPSADCKASVTDLTGLPPALNQLLVNADKAVGAIDHNIWDGYILESYSTTITDVNYPFWELMRQTGIFQYARADCIFTECVGQEFIPFLQQLVQNGTPTLDAWGNPSFPLLGYGSGVLYNEDTAGNPVYNFYFLDAMLDMFVSHGLKPLLQLEYMPEKLVNETEKIRNFQGGLINGPNDLDKWRELCYQTARHCIERYGIQEVQTWFFTLREEPDMSNFFTGGRDPWLENQYYMFENCPDIENPIIPGSMDNYLRMYDYYTDGVKAADPRLKVGGPNISAHDWFRPFLEHCVNGINFASGKTGSPLDAIFWHSYGPIDFQLKNAAKKLTIINQYPSLKSLPTIIDEWGETCWKMIDGKAVYYEGGKTLYTNYDAAYLSRYIDGALTEPEKNPSRVMRWGGLNNFGVRYLSIMDGTHFIPMPILNNFILLGKMGNERVEFTGGQLGAAVHGFASRTNKGVQIMLYNFNEADEEGTSTAQSIDLTIKGLPADWTKMKRYLIDSTTSNAWANHEVDTALNSPGEYARAEADSKLKIIEQTDQLGIEDGQVTFRITLPANSVSLVVIGKEAAPLQLKTTPHIKRLIAEEAAYLAASKTNSKAGYEQLVNDSFTSGGIQTANPYSIWGKKALWALYTIAKTTNVATADELRIRLLATTTLNDVERFVLLNERVKYLESIGNTGEILALQTELALVKAKLEYFANWTRWYIFN
jgi:xylan 1,4-beta-xylosidase